MNHTQESLNLTTEISDKIGNKTFHHHYHILYDISETFPKDKTVNYLEIGCYAGGSACLLLQRPNTNVISIDLGSPISKNVVEENVTKLNKHKNNYTYIEGNSHLISTYDKVSNIVDNIDILFIDGDHTYDGARTDFEMYSKLVNDGGYIIFDDYNDSQFSPDVKRYVNDLVKTLGDEYEIIGTLPNTFNARPESFVDGNCFIIKKNIKIGIIIPTYQRNDGKTLGYLKRALTSIKNQTFKNYKVFLIGDRYENNEEFNEIASSIIDVDKIYFENLPVAQERDNYTNKLAIWNYGGVNSTNHGIEISLKHGYNYISHLDHDDHWLPEHLLGISRVIAETSSPFICTKSTYGGAILPSMTSFNEIIDFTPGCGRLIHSSVCVNFNLIPLRYRDLFKETGQVSDPSDGDLWNRIGEWLKNNNKKGYLFNKTTCTHEEEGYERR